MQFARNLGVCVTPPPPALLAGDRLGLVAAHFPQEWDGGYFHNKQGREEGDVKKTHRILTRTEVCRRRAPQSVLREQIVERT